MKRSVAVIGGGVAGLTVAYELMERAERFPGSVEIHCFEATDRVGGSIRSESAQGFLCEWAANGFLDDAPAMVTLARRLGLQTIGARATAARRFLFRKGRLREIPLTPRAFLSSDVLSLAGRLRLLAEPLIPKRRHAARPESVFDFAARRMGHRAAELLIDAWVGGIYAGDARRLSFQACFPKLQQMELEHGSLFRALLRKRGGPRGNLTSFPAGMQELTDALARALGPRVRLRTPVVGLSDLGRRGFRVHLAAGAPLDVDAVAVACPAWESARILEPLDGELGTALAAIPSVPLAVVHLGFRRDALGSLPEGFGFLVPRGQGARMLGALWASDIFEGRAPRGSMLITAMLGGAHDPAAVGLEDGALLKLVRTDLQATMEIRVSPYFVRTMRHPRAIPQYDLDHVERLAAIERRIGVYPGLWHVGNSLRGISVNACVGESSSTAEEVLDFLGHQLARAAL